MASKAPNSKKLLAVTSYNLEGFLSEYASFEGFTPSDEKHILYHAIDILANGKRLGDCLESNLLMNLFINEGDSKKAESAARKLLVIMASIDTSKVYEVIVGKSDGDNRDLETFVVTVSDILKRANGVIAMRESALTFTDVLNDKSEVIKLANRKSLQANIPSKRNGKSTSRTESATSRF